MRGTTLAAIPLILFSLSACGSLGANDPAEDASEGSGSAADSAQEGGESEAAEGGDGDGNSGSAEEDAQEALESFVNAVQDQDGSAICELFSDELVAQIADDNPSAGGMEGCVGFYEEVFYSELTDEERAEMESLTAEGIQLGEDGSSARGEISIQSGGEEQREELALALVDGRWVIVDAL